MEGITSSQRSVLHDFDLINRFSMDVGDRTNSARIMLANVEGRRINTAISIAIDGFTKNEKVLNLNS